MHPALQFTLTNNSTEVFLQKWKDQYNICNTKLCNIKISEYSIKEATSKLMILNNEDFNNEKKDVAVKVDDVKRVANESYKNVRCLRRMIKVVLNEICKNLKYLYKKTRNVKYKNGKPLSRDALLSKEDNNELFIQMCVKQRKLFSNIYFDTNNIKTVIREMQSRLECFSTKIEHFNNSNVQDIQQKKDKKIAKEKKRKDKLEVGKPGHENEAILRPELTETISETHSSEMPGGTVGMKRCFKHVRKTVRKMRRKREAARRKLEEKALEDELKKEERKRLKEEAKEERRRLKKEAKEERQRLALGVIEERKRLNEETRQARLKTRERKRLESEESQGILQRSVVDSRYSKVMDDKSEKNDTNEKLTKNKPKKDEVSLQNISEYNTDLDVVSKEKLISNKTLKEINDKYIKDDKRLKEETKLALAARLENEKNTFAILNQTTDDSKKKVQIEQTKEQYRNKLRTLEEERKISKSICETNKKEKEMMRLFRKEKSHHVTEKVEFLRHKKNQNTNSHMKSIRSVEPRNDRTLQTMNEYLNNNQLQLPMSNYNRLVKQEFINEPSINHAIRSKKSVGTKLTEEPRGQLCEDFDEIQEKSINNNNVDKPHQETLLIHICQNKNIYSTKQLRHRLIKDKSKVSLPVIMNYSSLPRRNSSRHYRQISKINNEKCSNKNKDKHNSNEINKIEYYKGVDKIKCPHIKGRNAVVHDFSDITSNVAKQYANPDMIHMICKENNTTGSNGICSNNQIEDVRSLIRHNKSNDNILE